jgi:RNA-directed DNA polymerase
VNTDAPWPDVEVAWGRVLGIQTKLHQWATGDADRRFNDLYNLVCDPAFLVVAWDRVRGNRGARSAGVDGQTARYIEAVRGRDLFLGDLRAELKARTFMPLPVRERMIPKAGGKLRRLGIPTVRDRVAQAALKLVLEPIFEADFQPVSYGFRPRRRAQDAIAEIHHFTSRSYEWVVEGDITACFDEIDHTALMGRVRRRVGDKRVLGLVKAFLKAGILTEDGAERDTITGTPQGGILSPLLANIALSVLDDHFVAAWEAMGQTSAQRQWRRRQGLATYRLVRYADDWVLMVAGTQAHAEALRDEAAAVLAPMGLRLSEEKTRIVHIDEGFDFLGFRIQRHTKRGTAKRYVYTYPSKKALASIKARVRGLTRGATDQSLATIVHRLNPVLRGWTS